MDPDKQHLEQAEQVDSERKGNGDGPSDYNFEGLELLDVVPKLPKSWWHYKHLRDLNFLLLAGIMWSTASGFDGSLFNGMQALPQWKNYFGNPTGNALSMSSVPQVVANLIATALSYLFVDRFGRRWSIIIGSLLLIFSSILRACSQNYVWWCCSQIPQGVGVGLISTSCPPYISETAYPTHRAKAVSLYAGTYAVGGLIAAGMNWGLLTVNSTWAWRTAVLAQVVPSGIQCVIAFFAPESPRWLIYKNRPDEAFEILVKYHAGGDRTSKLVHFEMAEIRAKLDQEKLTKAGQWKEYLRTPGNRHRLAITIIIPLSLQWVGNALISYYLPIVLQTVGITEPGQVLGINLGNSAVSLIGSFLAVSFIDGMGRRKLFLLGYSLMLCALIIWTICSAIDAQRDFKDKGLAAAVVLMIYLFGSFYHLSSSIAANYIMEISVYSLRSRAAGAYQFVGGLAGLFNTWVNPIAMVAIGWKYYTVWTVLTAFWLLFVYFYVPETKGKSLEEVAVIFDGDDAIIGTSAMGDYALEEKLDKESTPSS
ncbi:general substrate transporter [Umbelopsis sp. PMI_123]|nr:general substrate transporter [Umbelopsis sp. PMI_123]